MMKQTMMLMGLVLGLGCSDGLDTGPTFDFSGSYEITAWTYTSAPDAIPGDTLATFSVKQSRDGSAYILFGAGQFSSIYDSAYGIEELITDPTTQHWSGGQLGITLRFGDFDADGSSEYAMDVEYTNGDLKSSAVLSIKKL